jgi:hypothetical protein
MGGCSSKGNGDVVMTKAATKDVEDSEWVLVDMPAPSLPDSYYEGMGLVKVGPATWHLKPDEGASAKDVKLSASSGDGEAVAVEPAPLQADAASEASGSRFTGLLRTVGNVVVTTALYMLSPRGAASPTGGRAEKRCNVCTFKHYSTCDVCPRCGS